MASGVYTAYKKACGIAGVDSTGHSFKTALMNSSHAFNNAHQYWTDTSGNEISGTGYSAGGSTLSALTWSTVDATAVKWDANDIAWTGAAFTAYHAVVYDDSHPSKVLVCSFDFGGAQTVSGGGTFTIQWNSSGILKTS